MKLTIFKQKYLYPFLVGALLACAFAPISLVGLGIISLAWLFYQLISIDKLKPSFRIGWVYGVGLFAAGTSWIYVSIHTYGRADVISSILVTILFCVFMGLYYALFTAAFSLWSRLIKLNNLSLKADFLQNPLVHEKFEETRSTEPECTREYMRIRAPNRRTSSLQKQGYARNLINFSVLWVVFEYLRANLFTGFPWLLLGFSQTETPMKYLAPIVGVYGLSFFMAFSAGLLAIGWIKYKENQKKQVWIGAILGMLFLYSFPQTLSFLHWTSPVSSEVPVSIIQGNIGEDEKWLSHAYEKTITHYVSLTRYLLEKKESSSLNTHSTKPRIIVWPEGAVPAPYPQSAAFLTRLSQFMEQQNATLITGIPYQNPHNNEQYYNAMLLLGKDAGHYFKHHIVPFGEYFPAEIFHDIMEWLGVSLYETGRGAFSQPLLNISGIPTLPFICYEIAYADILFKSLPEAQLFITISDDAWFGHSLARSQHLQMAQMRSLQTGRYQIVATNNGISAIIDAEGNVIKTVPSFETRILNSSIKPMSGSTPWAKIGDDTILISLLILWMLVQMPYFFRLKCRSRVCQHSG